jgi:hypothetical protein
MTAKKDPAVAAEEEREAVRHAIAVLDETREFVLTEDTAKARVTRHITALRRVLDKLRAERPKSELKSRIKRAA